MENDLILGLSVGILLTSVVWYIWLIADKYLLNYFAKKQKMSLVYNGKQEVDKSLMNVLKKKITSEEYLTGKIEYFFSWKCAKEFLVFLILLSIMAILFGYTNLSYTQRNEAILYEKQSTYCNGEPVTLICQNGATPIFNYPSFPSSFSVFPNSSSINSSSS